MVEARSSSPFTNAVPGESPPGPPLIGALLRTPWEAVQRHMLDLLHERGFDDLDAAHLNVFQYPGPEGARPSELAARLRISKQALNYLLGELERLEYVERQTGSQRSSLQARRRHPARRVGDRRDPRGRRRDGDRLGAPTRPGSLDQLRGLLLELNSRRSVAAACSAGRLHVVPLGRRLVRNE